MRNNIKNIQIKLCYPVEKIFQDIVGGITDAKTHTIKYRGIVYHNTIYHFNSDKCIAAYDSKTKHFSCDYINFWSKFYLNYSFNYIIIKHFLNSMVEKHFKLKEITIPRIDITKVFKVTADFLPCWLEVENHFK